MSKPLGGRVGRIGIGIALAVAYCALVLPVISASAAPITFDREQVGVIAAIDFFGLTEISLGQSQRGPYSVLIAGGSGIEISEKYSEDGGSEAGYGYGWKCDSGGVHVVKVTYPNGSAAEAPFVLPPEPCLHRYAMTDVKAVPGRKPTLSVWDQWNGTPNQVPVRVCWQLRERRGCGTGRLENEFPGAGWFPAELELPRLPRRSHAGEAITLTLRAGKDSRTTHIVRHLTRRRPEPKVAPPPELSPPGPNPATFIKRAQANAAATRAGSLLTSECVPAVGQPAYYPKGTHPPVRVSGQPPDYSSVEFYEWECEIVGALRFNRTFVLADGTGEIRAEVGGDPFEVHLVEGKLIY